MHKRKFVEQQLAVGTERIRASLRSLPVYELHKRLVNDYILCRQGATSLLQRDTSRDKHDIDVIRENHRFLWDEEDTPDSWEARLAKKYYDKLFKEYCICDLSRYKENKIAMRWRTEQEVVTGKGQFSCGHKKCEQSEGLRTWEVNFAYKEQGGKKNALVKLRLCPECSDKLNHHHKNKEVLRNKSRKRRGAEESGPSKKMRDTTCETAEETGEENEDAAGSEERQSAEKGEENIWKERKTHEEKSRDEEFQEYLEDLFL